MGARSEFVRRVGAGLALVLEVATGCGRSRSDGNAAGGGAVNAGRGAGSAGRPASAGISGAAGRGATESGGSAGLAAAGGGAGTAGDGTTTTGGDAGQTGSEGGAGTGPLLGTGGAGAGCGSALSVAPTVHDLYFMLDVSGSMLDPSGSGTFTKWYGVRRGVVAFLDGNPELRVALGYFPQRFPGVPDNCVTDEDCGAGAPCLNDVCEDMPGALVACSPASDPSDLDPCSDAILSDDGPCTSGTCVGSGMACDDDEHCRLRQASLGRCVELGVCEADTTLSCADTDPARSHPGCGPNGSAGKCTPTPGHSCLHETECDPAAYATPAFDFSAFSEAKGAIEASLEGQTLRGDSPARAALSGAVAHARAWSEEHDDRPVAVVLATDGLPTACSSGRALGLQSSAEIDALVSAASEGYAPTAASGAPSVRTFVLGAVGDADTSAAEGLDRVAAAGGTEHAYLLSGAGGLEQEVAAALRAIRDDGLGCEFTLVAGTNAPNRINVTLADGGGDPSVLENVPPNGCSGSNDEWHFDVDPTSGQPNAIVLCPATCDLVKASPLAQLSVLVGCT